MKISSDFGNVFLDTDRCKLVTFVNPYSYGLLIEIEAQNKFDYIFADGISLVKVYNIFNQDSISRFSFDFTSVAHRSFEFFTRKKLRVGLIGGAGDEVLKAKEVLLKYHSACDIVFCHDGYISSDFERVIDNMIKADVQVVIASMGTPLQELFLLKCKEKMINLKFGFTCGGFFTQIATNEEYFHPLFDKLNLRWFQRFCRHSFVRKRLLCDYPKFFISFIFKEAKKKWNS